MRSAGQPTTSASDISRGRSAVAGAQPPEHEHEAFGLVELTDRLAHVAEAAARVLQREVPPAACGARSRRRHPMASGR